MGFGKVQVIKLALINLGISTTNVMGPSSTDRNYVLMQNYFDIALEKTLMDHDWNCASAFRTLTPDWEQEPHPNYLYSYDYPNDCLIIREIYQSEKVNTTDEQVSYMNMRSYHPEGMTQAEKQLFEVCINSAEKKTIYTNASCAMARYTRNASAIEREMSPDLAMALSWYLAFLTASAITGARTKAADCLQIYQQMVNEARVADANEAHTEENENDWIEARN